MVSQVVERPDEMRSMIKNLLITTGSVNPKNVSKDLKEELYRIWRPGKIFTAQSESGIIPE